MSKKFRLMVGAKFLFDGRLCEITEELPDGHVALVDLGTGGRREVTLEALQACYMRGEIEPPPGFDADYAALIPPTGSLSTEPKEIIEKTIRNHRYNQAVDEFMDKGLNKAAAITEAISRVSKEMEDANPPSASTLAKLHRRHRKANGHVYGSMPRRSRGNHGSKLNEVQFACLQQATGDSYLTPQRGTYRRVHARCNQLIALENQRRDQQNTGQGPVATVSYVTVRRHIIKLHNATKAAIEARFGKKKAEEAFRNYGKMADPTRVVERVLLDHKQLDIIVVDDATGIALKRPWLTVAIDYFSRSILGFVLRLHPPDHVSVMACLRCAIFPKTYVAEKYPDIKGEWITFGVPEVLFSDNGADLKSYEVDAILLELCVHHIYGQVKAPWYRGVIEKLNQTIQLEVIDPLQGKTFSNTVERGDYDSVAEAAIGFEFLVKRLHQWIIEDYQRREHATLRCSPNAAWQRGAKVMPPALPPDRATLSITIGKTINYTNDKNGIRILNLVFDSPELLRIREKHGKKRLRVKTDPFDCSHIFVLNPDTLKYIEVPCVYRKYATNLTWDQHEIIRKRVDNKNASEEELALARARLAQDAQNEIAKRTGTNDHADLALGGRLAKLADLSEPITLLSDARYQPGPTKAVLTPLGESLNDADDLYGISEVAAESPDAADQDDDATEMDPAEHDVLEAADD